MINPDEYTCETREDFKAARLFLELDEERFGKLLGYRGNNVVDQIKRMESGSKPIRGAQIRLVELYVCDGVRSPDWDEPEEIEVIEALAA